MKFWMYFPERVLLSEKIADMSARQFGAYWLIISRSMMESPPGVIALDQEKLMKWGKLKAGEWEKDRLAILSPFAFHPATGTLHHEFVKYLYLHQCETMEKSRQAGSKGAAVRWGKSKGKPPQSPPNSPPMPTLYGGYKPPFMAISEQNLGEVLEMARNALISLSSIGSLMPPYSNKESNNKLLSNQPGAAAAPLGAGSTDAGGKGEIPGTEGEADTATGESQPIGKFLKSKITAGGKS